MDRQPELSVADFFKFGSAAAEHSAALRSRFPVPPASEAQADEPAVDD